MAPPALTCPAHRQYASFEVTHVPRDRVATPTGSSPSHLNAHVPVVVRCVHAGAAIPADAKRAVLMMMIVLSFIAFSLKVPEVECHASGKLE
jgi:hypothetical protein